MEQVYLFIMFLWYTNICKVYDSIIGKERGDRHPKIGAGVVLQDSASVLGNIVIGDGAVITAKVSVLLRMYRQSVSLYALHL